MPAWVGLTNGISWELLSDKPDGVDRLPSTGRETEGEREKQPKSQASQQWRTTRRDAAAKCLRPVAVEHWMSWLASAPKCLARFFFFFAWRGRHGVGCCLCYKHSMLLSTCCRIWLNKSKTFATRAATFCRCCLPVLIVRSTCSHFYIVLFTQQLSIVVILLVVVQL